jgi:hypothetical protein
MTEQSQPVAFDKAPGIYIDLAVPMTVFINPKEVLESRGLEPSESLMATAYDALAKEYIECGYVVKLIKEAAGNG